MNKTKRDRTLSNPSEANRLAFGDRGFNVLDNTSTANTDTLYGVLQGLTDTSFTCNNNSVTGDQTVNITIKEGFSLYGNFDNINITSGSLIGYIK